MEYALGIDIGGTAIKGSIVGSDGKIYSRVEHETCIAGGRKSIISSLFGVIEELMKIQETVCGIGIGSAGRINPNTGEVIYATNNLPGWTGVNIKEEVENRFGLMVKAENDVRAALLGEAWIGAGRGYKDIVMLALGTGVGGANMIDGKIVYGSCFYGGEWGHVILIPEGLQCNCGKKGCMEQYLSGTALVREAVNSGINVTGGSELMELYRQKDETAVKIVDKYINFLAVAVYNIHISINPEAVIIGGGVINSKEAWWKDFEEKVKGLSDKINVLPAGLGNDAGFIGAAKSIFHGLKARGRMV